MHCICISFLHCAFRCLAALNLPSHRTFFFACLFRMHHAFHSHFFCLALTAACFLCISATPVSYLARILSSFSCLCVHCVCFLCILCFSAVSFAPALAPSNRPPSSFSFVHDIDVLPLSFPLSPFPFLGLPHLPAVDVSSVLLLQASASSVMDCISCI